MLGMMAVSVLAPVAARAQATPPPPVEVIDVKFNTVSGGSAGSWYEIEVQVQPRPGIGTDNRRFLDRVKVTLNLGIFSVKAPSGSKIPDTYYRASAEAVALEATGSRSFFRFYLPPEIVKRDQLSGPQRFYLVELAVGGTALPLTNRHYHTSTLTSQEIVESFRSKVASESGATEGVMVPQYFSPFEFDNQRQAPTFIRVENRR